VLKGSKQIGNHSEVACPAGNFLFLSNRPTLEMRNIPAGSEYAALIIEFDYDDFECFSQREPGGDTFFDGPVDLVLEKTLEQFISWSAFAPQALWPMRRQELLQLLYHAGYPQVSSVMEPPSLSHRIFNRVRAEVADDLSAERLSSELHMSEATLRRRLSAEGTSLQAIKDQARLGYGLHLVQTTPSPIGRIAEQCGYQSQSRFTDKFKQLFGMTPSELRKTQLSG